MAVIKVQMLSSVDENTFVDYWLRTDAIQGFLIPTDDEVENECETINITLPVDTITVKREVNIQRFLTKEFVEKAKEF